MTCHGAGMGRSFTRWITRDVGTFTLSIIVAAVTVSSVAIVLGQLLGYLLNH